MKRLKSENEHLTNLLRSEKEKCLLLESTIQKEGYGNGRITVASGGVEAHAKRIAMLEMKEIENRQSAEHAKQVDDFIFKMLNFIKARIGF